MKNEIIELLAHVYSLFAAIWFIVMVHYQPIWFLSKIFFTFLFVVYIYYNYQLIKNKSKKNE
ncbi:hypothetical protein LCGC14_0538150 [marine sediment metagenome]|uniref:Uncharacterized protein n=1 Tax=marine sediment metagenome TaxID=412755 RepID=A0A0F9SC28_9ZZZZ|nr:hypothetical protein [bacterium]